MALQLSEKSVFRLLESKETYPINFDDAWMWLGYSSKGNAKRMLGKCEEDLDYKVIDQPATTKSGAKQFIKLTIEAFKHICMMSGTPRGKDVRVYFLNCEKLLKEQQTAPLTINPKAIDFTANLNDVGSKAETRLRLVEAADKFLEKHPHDRDILMLILKE